MAEDEQGAGPDVASRPRSPPASSVRLAALGSLAGRRVLVTAGGTREPLDAVRYLGNRSSGRMGVAVADEAARRGADVTLILAAATRHAVGADAHAAGGDGRAAAPGDPGGGRRRPT